MSELTEGRCSRCYGPALSNGDAWWHDGTICQWRVWGPWPMFQQLPPSDLYQPKPLRLPDRIRSIDDAVKALLGYWPILTDAVEPGKLSRAFTRRGDNRAAIEAFCDTCGARRYWRSPTNPNDTHERLRPYCPRCDIAASGMATMGLPINVGVEDVLIDGAQHLIYLEKRLCHAIGLTPTATNAATARLERIQQLLPSIGDSALAAELTEALIALVNLARGVLHDHEPVVKIDGRCPWCGTIGLVMYPDRGDIHAQQIGDQRTWVSGLVVCTYRRCECHDEACRCHRRDTVLLDGRRPHRGFLHQWTNPDWPWLSRLIGVNLLELAR